MILKKLKSLKHRWHVNKTQKAIDDRLRVNLEQWVKEEKYTSPSPMDMVAEELDVSMEQLRHYFAKHMHIRFYAWRKNLRIEKACALMKLNPEIPASEIGRQCGFNDKSTFRRQFMEIKGISPTEWKGDLIS